jgi:nucleoside-triphosphatase
MEGLLKNILLTGPPGIGKTTIIMKLIESLRSYNPVGFFTEEIREGPTRKGFKLTSCDGDRSVLSHVDIKSGIRVGKYGVDVEGFELFLDNIDFFDPLKRVIIIDEIGKMECMSRFFTELIGRLLDSEKPLIATIALRGTGVIDNIKKRSDIKLVQINHKNRDSLPLKIIEFFRK